MTRQLIACAFLMYGGLSVSAKDGWHRSFAEALAEAQRSKKPIFLVFRCER